MSALTRGIDLLAEGAPIALIGATALMLLGAAAGWRSGPALRQRIAEASVACAVVWAALAIAPLPRVSMPRSLAAESAPTTGHDVAPRVDRVVPESQRATPSSRTVQADRAALAEGTDPGTDLGVDQDPRKMEGDGAVGASESTTGPQESEADLACDAKTLDRGASALDALAIGSRSTVPNPTQGGAASEAGPSSSISMRGVRTKITSGRGWVIGWLLGAGLVSAWLLIGLVRVLVTLRRSTRVEVGDDLPTDCHEAPVLATDQPVRPFCFGVRRPVIVIPRSILTGDPSIRRSVLHHEAVHYARRDGVGQLIFAVAWPLFFFHPLLWILRRRARFAAEILADDGAVLGRARSAYARDLIRLAEASLKPAPAATIAAAMTRSSSELTRRIEMLMQPSTQPLAARCSRSSRWLIAGAAAFALIPSALVFGARPAPPLEIADAQDDGAAAAELAALRKEREALKVALADLQRQLDQVGREQAEDPRLVEVVVQRGDTLPAIWERVMGFVPERADLEGLWRLNPTMAPEKMHVGQRLTFRFAPPRPASPSDPFSPAGASPGGGSPSDPFSPDAAHRPAGPERTNAKPSDVAPLGSIDPTILEALVQRIDVAAEMDIAQHELARLSRMTEQGIVPQGELFAADARNKALTSKAKLYDALIEMEIEATARRIESQKQVIAEHKLLVEKGFLPRTSLVNDEALLQRLQGQLMMLSRTY